MSPLAYHILAASGMEPPVLPAEPPASRGDRCVGLAAALAGVAVLGMMLAGWV